MQKVLVVILQDDGKNVISTYSNIKELRKDCTKSFKKCDFSRIQDRIIYCDEKRYTYTIKELIG